MDGMRFFADNTDYRRALMFEISYVDPKESECLECGSSFGIHTMKCSKFVHPRAGQTCGACDCKIGPDGVCGCNPHNA